MVIIEVSLLVGVDGEVIRLLPPIVFASIPPEAENEPSDLRIVFGAVDSFQIILLGSVVV